MSEEKSYPEHPEWAAVGKQVAIKTRDHFSVAVVQRQTRTMIIVRGGFQERRFTKDRSGKYHPSGETGDLLYGRSTLYSADDPEVSRFMLSQRVERVVRELHLAAKDVSPHQPQQSEIDEVRKAADAVEKMLKEIEEGKEG